MTNEDKIHALKLIKLKIEPPTANRLGWLETWIHKEDLEAFDSAIKALEQEPTTKNDLEVDCIDRAELLKAMDTWDKFGDVPNKGLIPLRTPTLQDRYVPYVKYDDMINCVKGMPPVTPQEPILDKIYADIQRLRGCSCSCSDGIIDDVEDILDKYKAESEVGDGKID